MAIKEIKKKTLEIDGMFSASHWMGWSNNETKRDNPQEFFEILRDYPLFYR